MRQIRRHRQLHIRIPRGDNRIRVVLQINGAIFLGGFLGLALRAERGAEFAEGEAVFDVSF